MAFVCAGYNARFDSRPLFSRIAHGPITGLQRQSKKPYHEQIINIERSVFTAKSQTSANASPY